MTRWQPARALPEHAFVPGRAARVACELPLVRAHVAPERWRDDDDWLFGVDLWNERFLWEAHEAWEGPWRAARCVDERQAAFLRGMIQCAASALHVPMQRPEGLVRLCERGTARLASLRVDESTRFMGLDVAAFVTRFRAFVASAPTSLEHMPSLDLA